MFYSPDSVCVVSERLILPFPEDLWVGDPCDTTLQSHRMTLCDTCVLQLLDERRSLVHLFGCGKSVSMRYKTQSLTNKNKTISFCLPATMSSRLKEFCPALLLAMQV